METPNLCLQDKNLVSEVEETGSNAQLHMKKKKRHQNKKKEEAFSSQCVHVLTFERFCVFVCATAHMSKRIISVEESLPTLL